MKTKMNLFYPVLFCFFSFGYFGSLGMASPTDHVQENKQTRGLLCKPGSQDGAELSLAQQIKYGSGVGGRGASGSTGKGYAGGASSKGYGGRSGSSSSGRQRGIGVIPVYAAGAGYHHRNHHNGGNSLMSYSLFPAIISAVLQLVISNAFSVWT